MKKDKEESLNAMYKAKEITIRPHILMCSVCQYGGGTLPPFPPDNLPEMLELILKKPQTIIKLVPYADWMMCAPCPNRASGKCVPNGGSGGLPNQMRDLRVLQKLGLRYGDTLKAGDLYRMMLEQISGTFEICRIEHLKPAPSIWQTACGDAIANSECYDNGRKILIEHFG